MSLSGLYDASCAACSSSSPRLKSRHKGPNMMLSICRGTLAMLRKQRRIKLARCFSGSIPKTLAARWLPTIYPLVALPPLTRCSKEKTHAVP